MARVTDQDIPSELRELYGLNLQPQTDQIAGEAPKYIKVRDPFRLPKMQGLSGPHIGKDQTTQRQKVRNLVDFWHEYPGATRDRWALEKYRGYSTIFYWNFFILEGLMGGGYVENPQMIKSIQIVKDEVPTSGGKAFTITAVDPAKTVVMLHGNSFISDKVQRGASTITDGETKNHALSPEVDPAISEVRISGQAGKSEVSEGSGEGDWQSPYVSALIPAQLTIKMKATVITVVSSYYWEIIEHKAQTIYPVLVSILTEAVNVDWAKQPDVAADISIAAVEYI